MVLDCYTIPLNPLSHSILMEWCVYKHQEWYPLNSERIMHFSQCLQSIVRLLDLGDVCITLIVCNTTEKTFLGLWIIQTRIQNVFEQLVCVEVDFRQRRTISKLLCDHRFRPREVCRKTDYLYSAASFYFLHWYQSFYRLFSMSQAYMINS